MPNAAARSELPLVDLISRAWTIHNIVKTLHAALPDDETHCDIPTRCLIRHVLELTEPLALDLMRSEWEARNA
ncbi:hypothetical protein [Burkholderia cepacia]|uniref:hypothetical protein n=1 Tax=Burkholderia cepacia TaxID=292 RepID=UPI000AA503DE|nr:hypothetical protein [Burkholderia cepacia]